MICVTGKTPEIGTKGWTHLKKKETERGERTGIVGVSFQKSLKRVRKNRTETQENNRSFLRVTKSQEIYLKGKTDRLKSPLPRVGCVSLYLVLEKEIWKGSESLGEIILSFSV